MESEGGWGLSEENEVKKVILSEYVSMEGGKGREGIFKRGELERKEKKRKEKENEKGNL